MKRVVFNQKGGVGKTSITCNLAAISAARGLRTLVVDLDVQGNTTHYLVGEIDADAFPAEAQGAAGLFKQTVGSRKMHQNPDSFVWETPWENLFLLPSSPVLTQLERELESRYKIYKLRDALQKLDAEYDRVYIDTPPNFNFYSKSALIAADTVLVPFDCDSFARQSLYSLMDNIAELQEDHNPDLAVEGIVINQFNSQARLPGELVAELEEEGYPVCATYLSASVKMRESHHEHRPLVDLVPSHKLTQQFLALYDELESGRD
ncbi:MAG TPA: cobalamin biosynthesis protein CobQ [Halieaceae bacterium]|jgi:chromosome partitioning protein|uniref:ParA family protein n=1 Tax=Haliea TaxID=475794 RepID=UPI000C5B5C45|nr:ParA family protein [Haliea sp.]HBQ39880.1 cobalamin biosynthesis protein CobQ [Halieaceae bacterium]MAY94097.1 cobalamin biosynthesis protein CobQ [Haliea sp.]MBK40156.1 cobalamin biosynthesis protein CobQ [Haliea sp.]MBP71256.1 cobalamin biosynthesis protein CobQ [Haliea sp.]HCD55972.1 cobalamin biosynthesis protein CobQ [Halieaceae bacterium]|tara:strand:- start:13585 stop:14373 length:789 start_codon:yes stop_codon:yes gene_type:complete